MSTSSLSQDRDPAMPVPKLKREAIHSVVAAVAPFQSAAGSGLAGRVIYIDQTHDIVLAPKEVVLTFDDGPVPKNTPSILDTLDAFGVKATFFMVGEMARSHAAIGADVARRGHTIGTHSYSHPNLAQLSTAAAQNEIDKGVAAVTSATGQEPHFFRFPYLSESGRLDQMIAARGLIPVGVDIDSIDYRPASSQVLINRVMAGLAKHGGGIILMHDLQTRTAHFLPGLLTELQAGGYKVVQLRYGTPPQRQKPDHATPETPTLVQLLRGDGPQ
ncbi:polysaccharide deacetylase family protein [Martelella sp. HB161492]|uniref:polysaccharide deacetylase family protein n=1 Tax=Martelella sp. HB161492 TaxID=2720726 RepID=UPI0015925764|nr:polysaccharide deacetylase family protein [Martelella sp. HB161492]